MQRTQDIKQTEERPLELGYVICKWCGTIIATLPTNRVRRIYGECANHDCRNENDGGIEID